MKMRKIGWILGMALLLGAGLISCEKEALDGEITIRFALGDGAYGTDETRGTGLEERGLAAETVVVPVEGVLHMYAMLEEDESSLRAAGDETMETGTIIVIAAYDENGDYVDQAEYEVTDGNGGIRPTDGSGRGLTITTTGDYTFVAYSLNEKESFAYSDNMGPYSANSEGDDPLWGSTTVTVTAGMNKVKIEMRHVFSKVKIRALSTELSGGPTISNVSATLVGYKAVIQDGAIGKGVAEDQDFAAFPASPTTDALSAPRVVYAGQEDVTVIKITSATIGGAIHTGSVARFNKKLLPGRSYTLTVKFDELVWAGSNVYWDVNRLTFYPAENTDNQGFQGVFFKFGSLVGISPAQPDAFSASTSVYVPNYVVGGTSTWVRNNNHGYTAVGWPAAASGTAENAAENVPYFDGSYTSADYTRNSTFVIDAERNTDAMYLKKRGDICQYIGKTAPNTEEGKKLKGYRLPTSSEFGTSQSDAFNPNTVVAGGWIWGKDFGVWPSANNAAGSAEGMVNLMTNFGYATNQNMGVTLPASGMRGSGGVNGFMGNFTGFRGHYWSGSVASDNYGWYLVFSDNIMYVEQNYFRSYALSVRCVRN
jgi:hypothetical protein